MKFPMEKSTALQTGGRTSKILDSRVAGISNQEAPMILRDVPDPGGSDRI